MASGSEPTLRAANRYGRADNRPRGVVNRLPVFVPGPHRDLTAAVEGVAHLTTDYPPAILPWMNFRTHNRVAAAHGALVIGLGLTLPGLSPRGRLALCTLGTMPITLAALSDTRGPQGGFRAVAEPAGPLDRAASSPLSSR